MTLLQEFYRSPQTHAKKRFYYSIMYSLLIQQTVLRVSARKTWTEMREL